MAGESKEATSHEETDNNLPHKSGKIKFYTMPPERNTAIVSSEIVTQWAKEFDLDAIVAKEESIVGLLPMDLDGAMRVSESTVQRSDGAFAAALNAGEEMEEGDDEEEEDGSEMDSDEAEEMELSSDGEDEYAEADTGRGKMMMMMPVQSGSKKPNQGGNNNNEEAELAGAAMSKGKKNKLLKRQQKRNVSSNNDEDDDADLVEEKFDFDEFVPTSISNQRPEEEDFEFKY